jgi:antitoxin ParD1/3/4
VNVSIGERWERFVDETLRSGRYGSASEAVREGLRLVEEREARLNALRSTLQASIDAGGEASDDEIDAALDERVAHPRRQAAAE